MAISTVLGLAVVAPLTPQASAVDILRARVGGQRSGSGASPAARSGTPQAGESAAAAAQAALNSRTALARNTRAIQAIQAMQNSARQAAVKAGNSAGFYKGQPLPTVPDGLAKGGLQVARGVPANLRAPKPGENSSLWTGAELPVQSNVRGRTNVIIKQTQPRAVLNWETFNVGKNTTLRFDQNAGGSRRGEWIAFNKVNDPSGKPSQILGSIEAPGQVYIINRNGIIFSGGAQLNLHTLVASTLPINDNLIASGLLDNPDSQFLFSALPLPAGAARKLAFNPRISDPLFAAPQPGESYTLAEPVLAKGSEAPAAAPTFRALPTGKAAVPLVAGLDYTLTIDPVTGKASAQFTPEGVARIGGAFVEVSYTPAAVRAGDVVVQKGARIAAPVSSANVGGRVALIGANVRNEGTISTPNGQTILAAGLQVGFGAHAASDPSLRGLDVYVGKVQAPAVGDGSGAAPQRAGTATNTGLIEAARGSVNISGKAVQQLGAIHSSTSVSLNGRIDLLAHFDAFSNTGYDPADPGDVPFLFRSTGGVTLGPGSVTQIVPEIESDEQAVGLDLALRSRVNIQGRTIHLGEDASLLVPNGRVALTAGAWSLTGSGSSLAARLLPSVGQVYLDRGASINVAGTTGGTAPLEQQILQLELRGAELAPSPLQRDGIVRGASIMVDLRNRGTFQGREWIGTPLGDVSGYANLIERGASQLTAKGGEIDIIAGGSVVLQPGSKLDVSGGWVQFEGGMVSTTRLVSGGRIFDIADATPDRVYEGFFSASSTLSSPKWGVSQTFRHPLGLTGEHYEPGYLHGYGAGRISISAPSMALDGELRGQTVAGPRQLRASATRSALPQGGALTLSFRAQEAAEPNLTIFPTPPSIEFALDWQQMAAAPFIVNAAGDPLPLDEERRRKVYLSPELFTRDGFTSLTLNNEDGAITVPAGVRLETAPGGAIAFAGANIEVGGAIVAPSGTLSFKSYNISPYVFDVLSSRTDAATPPPNPGRGRFVLQPGALLTAAGLLSDERVPLPPEAAAPLSLAGGKIEITAYDVALAAGSRIDVSGGAVISRVAGRSSAHTEYGPGGSITIKAGQDVEMTSLLDGKLQLGATLQGYSGGTGGALSVQAPLVQIGGTAARPEGTLLAPTFFQTGGFASYTVTGLGSRQLPDVPALQVAPGTVLEPRAESWNLAPLANGEVGLTPILKPAPLRSPVSVHLAAPGVPENFGGGLAARGDAIFGQGAILRTEPGASVSVSGSTVAMLGSIYAPGGSISIAGSKASTVFGETPVALLTTYIGPKAVLSAAGVTVQTPDPFGRHTGYVLPGGSVSVSGNAVLAAGSLIDVSGANGVFDIAPAAAAPLEQTPTAAVHGFARSLFSLRTVPATLASSGGQIILEGGEILVSDAALRGNAGGSGALGGSLSVSSGRFYAAGATPRLQDSTLEVRQTGGAKIAGGINIGEAVTLAGGNQAAHGFFSADVFARSGMDALELGGVVDFRGPITIAARGALRVADGGVLYADSTVRLSAPYVALGQAFRSPVRPEDRKAPFEADGKPYNFAPTTGAGRLIVNARHLDLGTLSLQGIGSAVLSAGSGDIQGNGIFNIAGDLTLRAGQVYPATASDFTIVAYDAGTRRGSVTIESGGAPAAPLSGGGSLSIFASTIRQRGVLRAPLGSIRLGWDGTGDAPEDLLAGNTLAFPVTQQLTLGRGSVTSVSGYDPTTGAELLIPYGVSPDGLSWIDPRGVDISGGGLPEKRVQLAGVSIAMAPGSTVDLRGGGDLFAYRWVEGQGGVADILAGNGSFAVLPNYGSDFIPYAAFNNSTSATNLIASYGPGYTNENLHAGDKIYLNGSASLAAGFYTLLPARYALLPGAVLVTPQSGLPLGTVETPEGSSLVAGYRYNGLDQSRAIPTISSWFEVASAPVVRRRAEYAEFGANDFLLDSAKRLSGSVPRRPTDSGSLLFQATQAMDLQGRVESRSVSGGRGSEIDISTTRDILVTGTGGNGSTVDAIKLQASLLSSFGAESLLIGGRRERTADGTTVVVATGRVTIDNAGSPLSAPDIILVGRDGVTLAPGAALSAVGTPVGTAEKFTVSGHGALLRLSSDSTAAAVRTSATGKATLEIGAGVTLSGGSLLLDSTGGITLDPGANLDASAYTLRAGSIAVVLDPAVGAPGAGGLILSGAALADLQQAARLSLASYSTFDLYGAGQLGSSSLGRLAIQAAQIRGFGQDGGVARIIARDLVLGGIAGDPALGTVSAATGSLEIAAGRLSLSAHDLAIDQFSHVQLKASERFTGRGDGGLIVQNDLTIATPVITGAAGSSRAITAGGALVLADAEGRATSGGLGASLDLTGASVLVESSIRLPSGSLSLRATQGDVVISGTLDVSGTRQDLYDATRFTDAGEIRLIADAGDVQLLSSSLLTVAAQPEAGNAGSIVISAAQGAFAGEGVLRGSGGAGGRHGSFSLDVAALPSTAALSALLTEASLTGSQNLRVRTGDVLIDGAALARNFRLSADQGGITLAGSIDASGATGGSVSLIANGDVTLLAGSSISVAGERFNAAGKGGEIHLESGAQRNGVVGAGSVDIQAGSRLDLSVAALIAGDAVTPGSSAYQGQFSGALHVRAPQTSNFTDIQVQALDGEIVGASSILVEGYRLYDLTSSQGAITTALQTNIRNHAHSFLGAAGTNSGHATAILNRLLQSNSELASTLVLAPGAELINRTGDLTLGTAASTATSDWNLAGFRFGAKSAPGVLTLRAARDIVFYNALSDGFTTSAYDARLQTQNGLLPVNTQSWTYRLSAGADLSAADYHAVRTDLPSGVGSLRLGKDNGANSSNSNGTNNPPGSNATTVLALANRFQVIRTGTGDIDIHTAGDVQLLNHFATIYTAGARVTNATLGGEFDVPVLGTIVEPAFPALYSMAGGNVTISAGGDIEHLTRDISGKLIADSQRQLPNNWLYRRGYADPETGLPGVGIFNDATTTTWWIDFSNFFQGVGALGGGNVSLIAGGDISNVDAVAPTNARVTKGLTAPPTLLELGGGDVTVRAGGNLDGGVYYVERGRGEFHADGEITTNATRSPSLGNLTSAGTVEDPRTWLPTTLFLGKAEAEVSAGGDVLLGPIANPFLLPVSAGNKAWNKSYFSTYAPETSVNVLSLGGSVTLRQSATLGTVTPLLQLWSGSQQLFDSAAATTASYYQPWLRLAETSVLPFRTALSLLPATLQVTAFSGDINIVGDMTLAPAPRGSLELLAGGAINALQPGGRVQEVNGAVTRWIASHINLSDANPDNLPSVFRPIGFPTSVQETSADFLLPFDRLFDETGSTIGAKGVLQTKLELHAPGPLHADDPSPVRLYAGSGDISGLTLFSPKAANVFAGRDIADVALYVQNVAESDTSVIAAGRDIAPYNANTPLRRLANAAGQGPASGSEPLAGDLQISGPGALHVLAGRNLDLGTGPANSDGTGAGIVSIGNGRNPALPFEGASLLVAAGIGPSTGLSQSDLDIVGFIEEFASGPEGVALFAELEEQRQGRELDQLTGEEQAHLAMDLFYRILREAGRDFPETGTYDRAFAAIDALFSDRPAEGQIFTRARDIRTRSGGEIRILAPGGGLTLANATLGNPLSPPGIVTESGGGISIFTRGSVDIGIGRIFTLRGGDEIIWSSEGDIAAGSSSKTVQSAPPTRVLIDPQSADVQTDLAGLATGGGIGVLATVAGVDPGNVDLIAPVGTVDAGDAGIRVSGNLSIAAAQVRNADNIQVAGLSVGTPVAPVVAAPNVGNLASLGSVSAAGATAAMEAARAASRTSAAEPDLPPSIINVEFIGYGGDEGEEEEEQNVGPSEG